MAIRSAALVVPVVLLVACSSDNTAPPRTSSKAVVPPVSTSASPTPARTGPLTTGPNVRPGEKPPVLAESGRERTPAGACAAAAYYFNALDWAIATNDDWLVSELALFSCKACHRVHAELEALRSSGETQLGGRIHTKSVAVDQSRYRMKYDFAIRVTYSESAVRLQTRGGTIRTTQPGVSRLEDVVFLSWQAGRWRVAEVAQA